MTAKAGVAASGYTFGVAAADFDNDGHTDLYVAGIPRSFLFRNRGDGTFEDVTEPSALANRQPWPIAAGWLDYNNDGRLDLFVVNYVRWDPSAEPFCGDSVAKKYRTWCHPKYYSGLPNTLFRNEGNGKFRDVSSETGIARHVGKGMGVAFADYDSDGDPDIFVTNDTVSNFLFRNDGNRFTEVAAQAGVHTTTTDAPFPRWASIFGTSTMTAGPDLFVTALANEGFPLYRNLSKGMFLDATYPSRIGSATLALSGWSNAIADFDNDGWKDLFAANGDVQDNTEAVLQPLVTAAESAASQSERRHLSATRGGRCGLSPRRRLRRPRRRRPGGRGPHEAWGMPRSAPQRGERRELDRLPASWDEKQSECDRRRRSDHRWGCHTDEPRHLSCRLCKLQ